MDQKLVEAVAVAKRLEQGQTESVTVEEALASIVLLNLERERVTNLLADKIRWITYVTPERVKGQEIRIEPQKLTVKAGTMELELDGACRGWFKIDGKPVDMVFGCVVDATIGNALSVTLKKYLLNRNADGAPHAPPVAPPSDLYDTATQPGWEAPSDGNP